MKYSFFMKERKVGFSNHTPCALRLVVSICSNVLPLDRRVNEAHGFFSKLNKKSVLTEQSFYEKHTRIFDQSYSLDCNIVIHILTKLRCSMNGCELSAS